MLYSIDEITVLIGAHLYGRTTDAKIEWLLTDSRSLTFPETTLFFALKTNKGNGADYIPSLYRNGVRNFVVNVLPENYGELYPEANFLVTSNPLIALQRLAERHRERFSVPIVAVTGSNGKTIVKEWLSYILSPQYVVTRSPKSYNSQVGVPLSVWLLNQQTQMGVFEAGISQPGEMAFLQDIIQPTIGVITNIGAAHQENFVSLEQKCQEKLSLFKDSEAIVYNADDDIISNCLSGWNASTRLLSWSTKKQDAYVYFYDIEKAENGTTFHYKTSSDAGEVSIPFSDEASLCNAFSCITTAIYLQMDKAAMIKQCRSLEPVAMRLEVKQGVNGCTLINDSYNSDLTSLDIALDFMNRRKENQKKQYTLILSDILQSGMPEQTLYKEVARLVNNKHIDNLIAVGDSIGRNMDLFLMNKQHYESTDALLESGVLNSLSNEVVLIKGARNYRFDRITALLEKKVHQTILEVNLTNIIKNVGYYRQFMQPETKMICMVKASAYGAGAVEISRTLQDHHIDYLAVAVADEGVTLRKAGITQGILVMNPEITAFKEIFDNDLEPEIYSFELLDAMINAAHKEGITNWPVHIKLDTGMHRLGFDPKNDMERLIEVLKHQNAVKPRSVFSHFAGSDSPEFDDFTHHQFELFDKASQQIQNAFSHRILRHICNSAGIERFPQYHLDMVRLGLGLYGINPINNKEINTVCTLKSVVLQIRDVPQEETVGYSRKGVLSRASRIADIPIGYADGLDRHLGRGNAYCLINGHKAPYVGNICMDVCMVDVTDIPCKVGDTVEIFGPNLPVSVLSDALDTIPYEVLTSVSERVARIYYQD